MSKYISQYTHRNKNNISNKAIMCQSNLPYPQIYSRMKWVGDTRGRMAGEGLDTERKTVVTYVPAYQKHEWADHAERLGMSQSEFVRTMVQAGRREFGIPEDPGEGVPAEEPSSRAETPRGNGFETRVRKALDSEEYRSWDELVAALTDDIEGRLDDTLQRLQSANEVRYSGRHGGYALTGDE